MESSRWRACPELRPRPPAPAALAGLEVAIEVADGDVGPVRPGHPLQEHLAQVLRRATSRAALEVDHEGPRCRRTARGLDVRPEPTPSTSRTSRLEDRPGHGELQGRGRRAAQARRLHPERHRGQHERREPGRARAASSRSRSALGPRLGGLGRGGLALPGVLLRPGRVPSESGCRGRPGGNSRAAGRPGLGLELDPLVGQLDGLFVAGRRG
ncbi:MAG: hypothetical protein MZU79_04095 [Anaerotruncus sp.]|nr:hypothetical protein [Anaerotruncus sp.]